MTIDSDTEVIETQLRLFNVQLAEIVNLLKEIAKTPSADDAPASVTAKHENPPE